MSGTSPYHVRVLHHPHGTIARVWGVRDDAVALLDPAERLHYDALSVRRKASWLFGRIALMEALRAAGAPREPLLSDDRGAPRAPAGFRASVSHKDNIAVAIAAHATASCHLGIDVEVVEPQRTRITGLVLTASERAVVDALAANEQWLATLLRFSIKEAVYKAIDPFVKRYVSFQEAEVTDLTVPEPSQADAPTFVPVNTALNLKDREGPFNVEATFARSDVLIATARITRDGAGSP